MHYLIAYDIADPRRLRRVATCLEQHALRVQKSVFTCQCTAAALAGLFRELILLIDVHEDTVQAWTLLQTTAVRDLKLGNALPARILSIVAAPDQLLLLEQTE